VKEIIDRGCKTRGDAKMKAVVESGKFVTRRVVSDMGDSALSTSPVVIDNVLPPPS
jgi:hypothetical protein